MLDLSLYKTKQLDKARSRVTRSIGWVPIKNWVNPPSPNPNLIQKFYTTSKDLQPKISATQKIYRFFTIQSTGPISL